MGPGAPAVQRMLGLLFDGTETRGVDSAAVSQIDRATAREGVIIPWYPAAETFLAAVPTPSKSVR